jgi:hypothetical protein
MPDLRKPQSFGYLRMRCNSTFSGIDAFDSEFQKAGIRVKASHFLGPVFDLQSTDWGIH